MKPKRISGAEKYNNKILTRVIKNRLEQIEEIISKCEDRIMDIIKSEEHKDKKKT